MKTGNGSGATGIVPGAAVLDLAGEWRLSGEGADGKPLECAAAVPGDVHSALFAAGLVEDPFCGRNEERVQWVGRRRWTFSREFDVAAEFLAGPAVVLRLEDCDTFAEVFVNGVMIGETRNRFRRWDFDARRALRPGRNEIRLVFDSAWERGDALAAAAGRPYPMSNSDTAWFNNGAFVRKPACHRGWDWGLAQMTTGPCGRVALLASGGGRVDYVYSEQDFSDDFSHCTLRVFAEMEGGRKAESVFEFDDPPLWWPAGQGPQDFVEVAAFGKKLRVGLRKIELDTAGGGVCFKVNGRPVFMKGANWIPCDAFESRQTPERYRDLLESAVAANMNMIRLWGGGQFEKDVFYDLCDELGLLVWHDLMFSCAVYPATDGFLAEIRAETVHQLKRLRDHACIALWCGDNECIGATRGWFRDVIPDSARPQYVEECRRRIDALAAAVVEADPTRRFWPSSPCSGEADFAHDAWHDDSRGDMHCWDVWAANAPFSRYRDYAPRFCSEFGFQSFPSREVAETFCELPAASGGGGGGAAVAPGDDFEWHQKCVGGNDRIRKTMERHFAPPRSLDASLYLSQVQQALAIGTAVESWRALRPRCMGVLYWQLDDLWPVSSWSSVEYGGKWKHLHYRARRFYAPVAVAAKPSKNGASVEFCGFNDTPREIRGEAVVRIVGFDGAVVASETFPAALPPGSAVLLASRPVSCFGTEAERRGRFLAMDLRAEGGAAAGAPEIFANDFFFVPFKDSPLEDARIEVAADGFEVTLRTDKPAFFVWLDAPGIRGEFSDDSFTLLPGEPRTLAFRPKDPSVSAEAFAAALTVAHLAAMR
ncbi:MAG: glycoside hydrolase family 2 protein [Kiritimatiellae bacterium]|nr:glycoside hydrolase family 2 protein [Kiritimatiellia bacterium]